MQNVFNSALMNDAIYKFKRYEDASLEYIGINRHEGDVNPSSSISLPSTFFPHASIWRYTRTDFCGNSTQNVEEPKNMTHLIETVESDYSDDPEVIKAVEKLMADLK